MTKIAGTLTFPEKVIDSGYIFAPGATYGIEDEDALTYLRVAFGAEGTDDAPGVVVMRDELDIDPETRFADGPHKGRRVMDVAAGRDGNGESANG